MKEYFRIKLLIAVVFSGKEAYFFENLVNFFGFIYPLPEGNGGILY